MRGEACLTDDLEHDPEKWAKVGTGFRKRSCSNKTPEPASDLIPKIQGSSAWEHHQWQFLISSMTINPRCAASSPVGTRSTTTAISRQVRFPAASNASSESLSRRTIRPHPSCVLGQSETTLHRHPKHRGTPHPRSACRAGSNTELTWKHTCFLHTKGSEKWSRLITARRRSCCLPGPQRSCSLTGAGGGGSPLGTDGLPAPRMPSVSRSRSSHPTFFSGPT